MRDMSLLLAIFLLVTSAVDITPLKFKVEKDVSFNVFTLKNPLEPQILFINNTKSIEESNFDPKIPTKIFVHGFQSDGELRHTLIDAYFTRAARNINLIEVDWERASHTINYFNAAKSYVEQIGNRTAQFVDFMVNSEWLELSDLTVIGFSLGAHIAGFTGKLITVGKLPKIIGLDPAAPLYSIDKPDQRLDSKDALYVETIHTSILGFFDPLGVVSFYPNGGRIQPGCSWDITGKCGHQSAYKYLALSIHSDQPLIGHLCKSLDEVSEGVCTVIDQKAVLGGEPGTSQQTPGIYYISLSFD